MPSLDIAKQAAAKAASRTPPPEDDDEDGLPPEATDSEGESPSPVKKPPTKPAAVPETPESTPPSEIDTPEAPKSEPPAPEPEAAPAPAPASSEAKAPSPSKTSPLPSKASPPAGRARGRGAESGRGRGEGKARGRGSPLAPSSAPAATPSEADPKSPKAPSAAAVAASAESPTVGACITAGGGSAAQAAKLAVAQRKEQQAEAGEFGTIIAANTVQLTTVNEQLTAQTKLIEQQAAMLEALQELANEQRNEMSSLREVVDAQQAEISTLVEQQGLLIEQQQSAESLLIELTDKMAAMPAAMPPATPAQQPNGGSPASMPPTERETPAMPQTPALDVTEEEQEHATPSGYEPEPETPSGATPIIPPLAIPQKPQEEAAPAGEDAPVFNPTAGAYEDLDGDGVPDFSPPLMLMVDVDGDGVSDGLHADKLGLFLPQSGLQNDRPFYANDANPDFVLWWSGGKWWIGKREQLGHNKGWLKVAANGDVPPESGWVVFEKASKKWEPMEGMVALPANRIVVSGELPEAASAHAEKLGSFAERAERVAGRPSYTREGFVMEGEGKSYAMWFHNFSCHWFVGPREAIGSKKGWLKLSDPGGAATKFSGGGEKGPVGVKGPWQVFVQGQWLDAPGLSCKKG